jgi:hypothetical protein
LGSHRPTESALWAKSQPDLLKKQFPRLGEIVLHCESQGWSSYMSEPRDKFALACAISIAVAAFSTDGLAAQAPVTHGNKSWTDRFGESREFAAFLEDWIAERIDPLDVEQVDSMDCEYLIDQRSNELIALALGSVEIHLEWMTAVAR